MQVVVVGGLGKQGSENDVKITRFNVLRGLADRRGGLTFSQQKGCHMQYITIDLCCSNINRDEI